jgi:hypothetical protein
MIRRHIEIEEHWFHWLCGIIEGEGTFARATPSHPRKPRVAVGMCDADTMTRFTDLIGTRMYRVAVKSERYPWSYRTELVGGSAVALMRLMYPHMSIRRQQQIEAAIDTYAPLRPIVHKTFAIVPGNPDERDRYWLAGYLDGEGYFGRNKSSFHRISPMVESNSTDLDVAEKVQRIWYRRYNIAIDIYTRAPRKAGYKPQYLTRTYGRYARWMIEDLYELLSSRRQEQIHTIFGENWRPGKVLREVRWAGYLWQETGAYSRLTQHRLAALPTKEGIYGPYDLARRWHWCAR